jgi:copper homeostasis protein
MIIEVITQNVSDSLQAEQLGVDRLELVSAMQEGGLTPSYGVLKHVLSSVSIPVQVMIRPHSYGFVYSDDDWKIIKEDISIIQELGGNRIVFGCITEDGEIDEALLSKVIEHGPELDITFHRAFDEVQSQVESYKTLAKYSKHVKRILTSGGKPKAAQATNELRKLIELSQELSGPIILPGSGVTPENIGIIHNKVGASEYHIGSGVRMDSNFSKALDPVKVDIVKKALLKKA